MDGADYLKETLKIDSNKITVIPHGIKISFKNKEELITNTKKVNGEKKYIIALGNIRPYKGTDLLIDAWKTIQHKHPNYDLYIAGRIWGESKNTIGDIIDKILKTSQYAATIRKKLIDHEKYNIKLILRYLEDEEIEHLICNASATIYPYRKFTGQSGNAALSAGYGVPIICSQQRGLTDLVADEIFIAKELTTAGLARTIDNAIKNINLNTRIKQWNIAQKNSWEKVAELHKELYESIAKK